MSKRENILSTLGHGQRLHHLDRQRGAEGLHVIVDGLCSRVALGPAGCGPDGGREGVSSATMTTQRTGKVE